MLRIGERIKANYIWALVIGMGLMLSPIHNQWLTNALTNKRGEVMFFLPAFGWAVLIMGALIFVVLNWEELDWGDRKVYIPLLIIVGAMGLSGITAEGIQDKFAPFLMGISLLAVYLVARQLGKELFKPMIVGVILASLGVIISGIMNPGQLTGGLLFGQNYDIVTGFLILGSLLAMFKKQWLLVLVALIGLFFTGAPEAVFAVGILAVVVLARRDWGKRLWIPAGVFLLLLVVWFGLGYGATLYAYTGHTIQNDPTIPYPQAPDLSGDTALIGRWEIIKRAMSDIQPFGEGYILTDFSRVRMVHNVPLVIVQQLGYAGILAGIAWLFVTIRVLKKTKWKYAMTAILALSVFDHFIWTQLVPWWWALVGVSTSSNIESDLIFRGRDN